MTPWAQSLLAVGLVSGIPLLGMLVVMVRPLLLQRNVAALVPFAIGALLGAAMLHLIPEALEKGQTGSLVAMLTTAGFLAFFTIDRLLHRSVPTSDLGQSPAVLPEVVQRARALVPLALAGDALHNVIDGVLVASAFLDRPSLGLVTGAAIALHELPREFGTFALLIRGGVSVRRAVLFNALTAIAAIFGALATLIAGALAGQLSGWLLPFAAGNFLYLATSIAIAEWRASQGWRVATRKVGLAAVGLLLTILGLHGH